jgi:hypothetical protein
MFVQEGGGGDVIAKYVCILGICGIKDVKGYLLVWNKNVVMWGAPKHGGISPHFV